MLVPRHRFNFCTGDATEDRATTSSQLPVPAASTLAVPFVLVPRVNVVKMTACSWGEATLSSRAARVALVTWLRSSAGSATRAGGAGGSGAAAATGGAAAAGSPAAASAERLRPGTILVAAMQCGHANRSATRSVPREMGIAVWAGLGPAEASDGAPTCNLCRNREQLKTDVILDYTETCWADRPPFTYRLPPLFLCGNQRRTLYATAATAAAIAAFS